MEFAWIDWLRKRVPPHPQMPLGPGDDCAWLKFPGGNCLATVDVLMDQVDFDLSTQDPKRIGRKIMAANLSDLAAMAAKPTAVLVGLVLPRQGGRKLAEALWEGMAPLAAEFGAALAGGDTNSWDGKLVASVTALGEPGPGGVLVRSGARPGDRIFVTGQFGGSILGKHLDFTPRVAEMLSLSGRFPLHAAIDVSDGLSADLGHIADESGVGVELWEASLPVSPAAFARSAELNGTRSPLECALGDGEDFEIVLAVPPETAELLRRRHDLSCGLTEIGRFTAELERVRVDSHGVRRPLSVPGWEHLFM